MKTLRVLMGVLLTLAVGCSHDKKSDAKWVPLSDTTCVASWNSASNNAQHGGTLIDSRHAVMAAHFPVGVGTKIQWVDVNGVKSESVVKAVVIVPKSDIAVLTMDPPLPDGIKPADIVSYSGPAWQVNQFRKVIPCSVKMYEPSAAWDKSMIDKDSGSPILVNINGKTCVIATATYPKSGPALKAYSQQIEAAKR